MKRITYIFTAIALLALVTLFVSVAPETSHAIPAFARKYKTSCATCHVGFPKLNAFGEAFRRNGYQFPGHTDPEFIKEDPVSLGADGNKKAFPDAIWPGSIPGSSPISLFLNGEVDYNPSTDPRFTFDGLGNSIETAIGGTAGEDLSFWAQAAFSSEGLELNRLFMVFSNIVGDSYALNARVGVFEPSLFTFSTHRAWMEGYWLTTRPFSGDMGWTMEETQKGLELNGMAFGRLAYAAGVVEGFGPLHADKDYYAGVHYKIGGLPLDGVTENGSSIDNTKPYIDNSFTFGGYVYSGNAVIGADTLSQANAFTMLGGDFNAWYDRFNLFGGIGIRTDNQPFLGSPSQSAKTTTWFTELDVVAYPWLLPGIRFESWSSQTFDPTTGTKADYSDVQIVPGVTFLIRPNVKMTLRTAFTKFDSNNDTKFNPGQVQLLMALGI